MSQFLNSVYGFFTTYPSGLFGWTAVGLGVSTLFILIRWKVRGRSCYSKALLNGKTAIITGANTGIGLETAVDFAQRNARVILACRSKEKGEAAVEQVKKRSGNQDVVFVNLDLSSLESVRDFSTKILDGEPHLDILVNNAGVFSPYSKTVDNLEIQFGVNHLGHFLLTTLLLERIKEAPSGRIVNLTSEAYEYGKINFENLSPQDGKSYSSFGAYSQSKLANILFTRSLSRRLEGTCVIVNAVHPGKVYTDVARHYKLLVFLLPLFAMFLKTPLQGAQTTIYCAVSEEMDGVSGQYLADYKIQKLKNPQATDDNIAERLWDVSLKMVGL